MTSQPQRCRSSHSPSFRPSIQAANARLPATPPPALPKTPCLPAAIKSAAKVLVFNIDKSALILLHSSLFGQDSIHQKRAQSQPTHQAQCIAAMVAVAGSRHLVCCLATDKQCSPAMRTVPGGRCPGCRLPDPSCGGATTASAQSTARPAAVACSAADTRAQFQHKRLQLGCSLIDLNMFAIILSNIAVNQDANIRQTESDRHRTRARKFVEGQWRPQKQEQSTRDTRIQQQLLIHSCIICGGSNGPLND